MMNISYIYPSLQVASQCSRSSAALACDILSLHCAAKTIKKNLSDLDAGGVTSKVNGSAMVKLVVLIHALLDWFQANKNSSIV